MKQELDVFPFFNKALFFAVLQCRLSKEEGIIWTLFHGQS